MIGVVMWGTLVSSAAEVPADLGEALLFFSDTDQSGMLDTALEIRGLTCEHWTTLDEIARATYGQPFWLVAGLEVGFPIGGGLPIDVNLWGEAATQLAACEHDEERWLQQVRTRTTVVHAIDSIPHKDLPAWEASVRRILVARFSHENEFTIQDARDVRRIRCDTWQAIGVGYERFGASILELNESSPATSWVGARLGFSLRVKAAVQRALRDCGDAG